MTASHIDPARWAALSPWLDQLIDADERARAGLLAQATAQDPLLAGELRALLARLDTQHDTGFSGFMQAPARRAAAPAGPAASPAGQRVGAYVVQHLLGQGGMGSVWLARRTDGRYDGQVAIKFLHGGLHGRGDARRFAREGQILARLDHPHIARLLDAGLTPDDSQPYLVLEFVQGLAIDAHVQQQALDTRATVALFIDVLAAVSHAHERLILHRDLKPSNILVTPQGQVKLLDFGIAKLVSDALDTAPANQQTQLTRQAGRAFTLRYAAPEQVEHGEATTATDVYALGVLLHVLLTGGLHPTAPTDGDAPLAQLHALVHTAPRRPSDAVARQGGAQARRLSRTLQGDLDTVIGRALKKLPAERYRNAAELADDLRRYLAHEPIAARPDSAVYRMAKFVRRNRFGVAAGTAVVLALGVGAGVALLQAREARAQSALASQQRQQAEGLVAFMLSDLHAKLEPVSRLDLLDAVATRALAYYDGQAQGRNDVDALSGRARALRQIGLLEERRGLREDAEQRLNQAALITGQLAARFPQQAQRLAEHGDSLGAQAMIASRLVHLDQALVLSRQALDWRQRALALLPADPKLQTGVANAWVELGGHLVNMHRPAEALAPLNEGLTRTLAQVAANPALMRRVVQIRTALGDAYFGQRAFTQAVAVLQPHWDALTQVPGGAADPELRRWRAEGMNRLSGSLLRLKRLPEADAASREAVSQFAALSDNDPTDLNLLNALCHFRAEWAEVLLTQSNRSGARTQLQQAAQDIDRLLAVDPQSEDFQFATKARVLSLLAEAAPEDPAVAKALQGWLDDVVPRFEARPRALNPYSLAVAAWAGLALGDVRAAQGHADAARLLWQRAAQRAAGPAAGGNPLATTRLAALELRLGNDAAAEAWAAKLPTRDAGRAHADVLRRLALHAAATRNPAQPAAP